MRRGGGGEEDKEGEENQERGQKKRRNRGSYMYGGHINKGRRACAPTTYWYQSSSADTSTNHHLPSYNPLSSLLSSVLSLASASSMQHLQNLNTSFPVQSWNEFMELSRFGKPDLTNLEHLSSRLLANLEYYSGNYLWIIGFLSVLAWYLHTLSFCL